MTAVVQLLAGYEKESPAQMHRAVPKVIKWFLFAFIYLRFVEG
jgi:hypothetical protein